MCVCACVCDCESRLPVIRTDNHDYDFAAALHSVCADLKLTYLGLQRDRFNGLPASASICFLFLAVVYRVQFAWYALEIASYNDSPCNRGFSSV